MYLCAFKVRERTLTSMGAGIITVMVNWNLRGLSLERKRKRERVEREKE